MQGRVLSHTARGYGTLACFAPVVYDAILLLKLPSCMLSKSCKPPENAKSPKTLPVLSVGYNW